MRLLRALSLLALTLAAAPAALRAQPPLGLFPPLKLVWEAAAEAPRSYYAAPTVAGDAVYATEVASCVHAFALADGRPLWSLAVKGQCYSGLAVAGGLGFVASTGGEAMAIDLATGQPKWRHALDGTVYATPVVAGDTVLIGTGDTGTVYALDAATGDERWTFPLGARMGSGLAVSPDGMVYVGSYDRHLYAIDLATARLRWQFVADTIVDSRPLVADGRVYLKLTNDGLVALDAQRGRVLWRTRPLLAGSPDGPSSWSPLVRAGDNVITALSDGRLLAVAAATGEQAWATRDLHPRACPPTVAGPIGYAGGRDGSLSALDLSDGQAVWELPVPPASRLAPLSGIMWPPTVSGAWVLTASMEGKLAAYQGDPTGAEWQRQQAAADTQLARLGPAVAPGLRPTRDEYSALDDLGARLPGGFVVWESNRSGAWELYRIATDGAGLAALTQFGDQHTGYDQPLRPRVSPDGSQVLFEYGPKAGPGESWLVPAAGGQPRKLCAGEPLNWAADGASFYLVRGGQLWQHTLADDSEKQLSTTALPVAADGRGLAGCVAPDLKAVALATADGIAYLSLAGGEVLRKVAGSAPQLTADGHYLIWQAAAKDFRVWDILANRDTPFLGEPPTAPHNNSHCPTIRGDGRWIAYCAAPAPNSPTATDDEIFVQELTDWQPIGPPTRLSWHPATDRWPALWAPAQRSRESAGEGQ